MNSLLIGSLSFILLFLGYKFYATFIENLFGLEAKRKTPAHEKYDGIDYVPAKHWTVLFGHHFASIAGAGPIIGPVIAVGIWGWGPALAWIILGTIFIGGVHDFGAFTASIRHGGDSIADIAEDIISHRAKIIFSTFVWLALILIVAVFVYFCAKTFVVEPKIVLPSLGLIPVALLVGFMLYNLKINQSKTTILGLALLAVLIILGEYLPIDLGSNGLTIWSIVLLIYCFIASVTPVQILLQPRDYLSSFLLVAGVLFGYLGLILSHPKINTPILISLKGSEEALWPMLFVTVACGAISGFHSLVASGTTSKQLGSEKDAKKIGYGAMVAEGLVAVLALLAVTAGLNTQEVLKGFLEKGGAGPIGAYEKGYSQITKMILGGFGGFVAVTILNAFILTTLDTSTRIGRYLTHELFGIKNRYLATLPIVLIGGWLALSGNWEKIWPAFGAANQLVGALALVVITAWLFSQKKKFAFTLWPAIFMLVTTVGALIYQVINYFKSEDYFLTVISLVLIVLAIVMIFEAIKFIKKGRK
jgi:carbon starvation protein